MAPPPIPSYWKEAKDYLYEKDKVLQVIINKYQGETLRCRGNAYETLARAIVGQQISVKAADSIWKKLEAQLEGIEPVHFYACPDEDLRGLGLSKQKILYLKTIAAHFLEGKVEPETWKVKEDAVIKRELTAIKGIGPWTAEMFLIFYLLKPDVLPLADIGLQKAIMRHYNGGQVLTMHEMQTLAEPWRPYRTVATWYLWRSLDPVPVEY